MNPVVWRHPEWKRTLLVRDPRQVGGPVLYEAQTRTHRSALTRADCPALSLSLLKDEGGHG
jgi:hypothetical protein